MTVLDLVYKLNAIEDQEMTIKINEFIKSWDDYDLREVNSVSVDEFENCVLLETE